MTFFAILLSSFLVSNIILYVLIKFVRGPLWDLWDKVGGRVADTALSFASCQATRPHPE